MAALPPPQYISCFGNRTLSTQPWPNQGGSLLGNHRCRCKDVPQPSDQWGAPPQPAGETRERATEPPG
jgi:hypothetical protein